MKLKYGKSPLSFSPFSLSPVIALELMVHRITAFTRLCANDVPAGAPAFLNSTISVPSPFLFQGFKSENPVDLVHRFRLGS